MSHPQNRSERQKQLILILGGARSGKSDYAQQLAERIGGQVVYAATAAAGDDEMAARIARHRAARPAGWRTVETTTSVGAALLAQAAGADVVLLDCLTLLVSNLLLVDSNGDNVDQKAVQTRVNAELEALWTTYQTLSATFIVVSNEVGLGLVPPYPLGRVYRDVLGRANQWLAARADVVYLLVAGLPMVVKGHYCGPGPAAQELLT